VRIGEVDGHGRYGHLDTVDGRLVCHECGRTYLHLATHLQQSHGLRAETYRIAHGLPLTIPLVAASVQQRMREKWHQHAACHLDALATHRQPEEARKHNRPSGQWTAATRAKRIADLEARRGRLLTASEMDDLGDDVPLQEWCDRVRTLLAADETVTRSSIGRSFGRSTQWATQRLRRYPPRA
jgi:phage tail protein X